MCTITSVKNLRKSFPLFALFFFFREDLTFTELMYRQDSQETFQNAIGDLCEPSVTCPPEVTSSAYRTFDGSCNNLKNPEWGKSFRKQYRNLPHTYADGEDLENNINPFKPIAVPFNGSSCHTVWNNTS